MIDAVGPRYSLLAVSVIPPPCKRSASNCASSINCATPSNSSRFEPSRSKARSQLKRIGRSERFAEVDQQVFAADAVGYGKQPDGGIWGVFDHCEAPFTERERVLLLLGNPGRDARPLRLQRCTETREQQFPRGQPQIRVRNFLSNTGCTQIQMWELACLRLTVTQSAGISR